MIKDEALKEKLKELSRNLNKRIEYVHTEEATKTALILPFIKSLGYDVYNPTEVIPEYIADIGLKKGEKVDYAILDDDGNPKIIIECKKANQSLNNDNISQLLRYFTCTTAKLAILTNGINYQFFSDLIEPNKMDDFPFLEIDLSKISNADVYNLKMFVKGHFNPKTLMEIAENLKYVDSIKALLNSIYDDPSPSFIEFVLNEVYDGRKNLSVKKKFIPIIKKSFTEFIQDKQ